MDLYLIKLLLASGAAGGASISLYNVALRVAHEHHHPEANTEFSYFDVLDATFSTAKGAMLGLFFVAAAPITIPLFLVLKRNRTRE